MLEDLGFKKEAPALSRGGHFSTEVHSYNKKLVVSDHEDRGATIAGQGVGRILQKEAGRFDINAVEFV